MTKKDYILFDLDGTLTDPKEGITKAVQYSLKHYGISVEDLDSLCPFIGPPLKDSYMEFYGFSPEQAGEAVFVFREYFETKGWAENQVFPGMKDMLARLSQAGKKLYVATSKPEVFAKRILEHFELAEFFTFIGGADFEETRVKKADVIRYVMDECSLGTDLESKSKIVMVGDRMHDIEGARAWGLDSIGVLYGYGDREELEAAGASAIAGSVEELSELLLSECLSE